MLILRHTRHQWSIGGQHRRLQSTVACWNCSKTVPSKDKFFCASCGSLQHVTSEHNFFTLLNVGKSYNIDAKELTKQFRQAQSVLHPDKFSQRPERERTLALEWSSLVNKAYKTLSKSVDRGKYILELDGIHISEDNSTVDQEFLIEMMEQNEQVDEAGTVEELQQLAADVAARIEQVNLELGQLFAEQKLQDAKNSVIRLKYLVNVEGTIREKILRFTIKS